MRHQRFHPPTMPSESRLDDADFANSEASDPVLASLLTAYSSQISRTSDGAWLALSASYKPDMPSDARTDDVCGIAHLSSPQSSPPVSPSTLILQFSGSDQEADGAETQLRKDKITPLSPKTPPDEETNLELDASGNPIVPVEPHNESEPVLMSGAVSPWDNVERILLEDDEIDCDS